ncbi:2-(3-amino-3-carboxypropyl)histidine synthase [Candidatus Bilamarchaeum dharawalense]|uniref:2-(3-amino-3-carboxypropyl)histidine synthase n=1 Tax=Candidatus Bilamarchaeum dharawalense TaxID=2885759 RepID=A0A5E4LTG9_9ARCH|nr:2-(3-amino-3-carboxypropyl)histidine synthase [Candidatus Bilamarchaeum dharawalense]
MKILLQFPDGLKQKAMEYAKKYEKEGHEIYLSASSCYGACDIAIDEARALKVDKIVHFGHNKFGKLDMGVPVEYIEFRVDIKIKDLEKALPALKEYKKITIGMTVQQSHQFKQIKEFFEKNGKEVVSNKGQLTQEEGQVLGCDAGAVLKNEDGVDAILFIGNGMFHPLAIDSKKPIFIFNPLSSSIKQINSEIEILRKKRKGTIVKALNCTKFGILLSTKPGQFNLTNAKWAKKEMEKRKLEAEILVANELEPLNVNNFMVFDCYINTACPRMSDDVEEYGKPVLTIPMLMELLKLMDQTKK